MENAVVEPGSTEADAAGVNGSGGNEPTVEQQTAEFFNPTFTPGTEGEPSGNQPDPAAPGGVTADETIVYTETHKVDGKEIEIQLTKADLDDRVRKGETFSRRMTDLGLREKALEEANNKPLTLEQQEHNVSLAALKDLQATNPKGYEELIRGITNKANTPVETQLDRDMQSLKKVVADNPNVPQFAQMATVMESIMTEMKQRQSTVDISLNDAKKRSETLESLRLADATEKVKNSNLSEATVVTDFLREKGISDEQITAKNPDFQKYWKPGTPMLDVAKMIFALELSTAKPPVKAGAEVNKPPVEAEVEIPPSMNSGSPAPSGQEQLTKDQKFAKLSMELVGRVVKQHGATD